MFEFIDDVLGALFFTCRQCDDCGMILRVPVTDDDLLKLPTDPPSLDKRAYWGALLNVARLCMNKG